MGKIIQRNDGLFVKEYFTIDYEKRCALSAMDSFNFEDFIKKYPMDSVNSKLYEKSYTWEEVEEYFKSKNTSKNKS